jgi:hypothetical protein
VSDYTGGPLYGGDSEADPFSLMVGAIASVVVIALIIAVLLLLR